VANTHLQTAHEYGARQALQKHGYHSVEEVQRDVVALGLDKPAQPQKTASDAAVENVFASLKAKLG
jgi:hypothetical protein